MASQGRRDSWVRLGLAGTLLAGIAGCGGSRPSAGQQADTTASDSTAAASADFRKRVDDYVALHNQLAAKMGPLDETKSQAEIAGRAATLGHLIVTRRANAKQGDIFTPEVAAVITKIIKEEASRRPPSVTEAREDQEEEHRTEGLQDFAPRVNQLYPTAYPLETFPPNLLPLLPKLPPELEYRMVSHYLILRDVEANLIVDFIPNLVP